VVKLAESIDKVKAGKFVRPPIEAHLLELN